MGGERTGKGKLVYLYLACLILLMVAGCAALQGERKAAVHIPEKERQESVKGEAPDGEKEESVEEGRKGEEKRPESRLKTASAHLLRSKRFLSQGEFDLSMKEAKKSLSLAGKSPPGDEALFTMGLLFIHYNNPKKEFRKSKELFERLVKEYPQSPLAEQARTWVDVLQVIEKSKQVDLEIEEIKKEMSR
ncbi:MAG: hypothetical protein K8I29_09910 [Alphaproteobacteria bacterium]|uniref:Tetratricopeptide repeat protein n=1 Tax=Candidatus Nitrobium versatile TaxID=2884831 RepID=A0A953J8G2_9BACT|nr:hypothetical protein [Candidatus Nitrobium versatile]